MHRILEKTCERRIVTILLNGAEAWTMTRSDKSILVVFGRKVLRKLYCPLRVRNFEGRSQWNEELYEIGIVNQGTAAMLIMRSCSPGG